jgi:hypothetical protein
MQDSTFVQTHYEIDFMVDNNNNVDIVHQFDHYDIIPFISDVNLTQNDTVIQ